MKIDSNFSLFDEGKMHFVIYFLAEVVIPLGLLLGTSNYFFGPLFKCSPTFVILTGT